MLIFPTSFTDLHPLQSTFQSRPHIACLFILECSSALPCLYWPRYFGRANYTTACSPEVSRYCSICQLSPLPFLCNQWRICTQTLRTCTSPGLQSTLIGAAQHATASISPSILRAGQLTFYIEEEHFPLLHHLYHCGLTDSSFRAVWYSTIVADSHTQMAPGRWSQYKLLCVAPVSCWDLHTVPGYFITATMWLVPSPAHSHPSLFLNSAFFQ